MSSTQIVGILNITPDSFSDGGNFYSKDAAIGHIDELVKQGADIIDIGAESTRPGASPLTHEEEWVRLESVLSSLHQFSNARFSLDTRHAKTAEKAIPLGIHYINDVSGFVCSDMVSVVKNSNCQLIMMHSLTVPADQHVVMDENADVVSALLDFAQERMKQLEAQGIAKQRIVFDPGIGFGKTAAQSKAIIERVAEFKILGVPILIGHSRKSFLSQYGENRDEETLRVSEILIQQCVDYIRVHDVAAHKQLLGKIAT
jgi:dihydropteroate synthase